MKIAQRRDAHKALFVSRIAPETTSSEIVDLLSTVVPNKEVVVKRLKTRYDTYASFYISVNSDVFELINNEDFWPDGCIFKPFYGSLDDSRVLPEQVVPDRD